MEADEYDCSVRLSGGHQWGDGRPHFHESCPCRSSSLLLLLSRLLMCLVPADLISRWREEEGEEGEEGGGRRERGERGKMASGEVKIPTRISVASSALAALSQFAAAHFPCFWSIFLSTRSHSPLPSPPLSSPPSASLPLSQEITLMELVVSIYSRHSDPLLRGHAAALCGQVISSLLSSPSPLSPPPYCTSSLFPPSPSPSLPPSPAHVFPCTGSQLSRLVLSLFSCILRALEDTSATTSKLAIRGLSLSLPLLSVSRFSSLSLSAARSLLLFPPATYWVVKKELLGVLSVLDFSALRRRQLQSVAEGLSPQMSADVLFLSEGFRCDCVIL